MNPKVRIKVEQFFRKYPEKTYEKGVVLTLAGEDPRAVTYLIGGMVEQYDITPEGNKVTVNIFKPPAFFPMSWALNQTPNEYFFETLSKVRVIEAPAAEAVAFLEKNGDVTLDLLTRVYKGVDALLRRIVVASSGLASARLAFEILIEAYRFGVEDEAGVHLKTTQADLASRTGLARETVSRELARLKDVGAVRIEGREMIVSTRAIEAQLEFTI